MKRIDRLGRIVIPRPMREKYGLREGVEIEFIDTGDGITVKALDSLCKLCRGKIRVRESVALCERCIAEVVRCYRDGEESL